MKPLLALLSLCLTVLVTPAARADEAAKPKAPAAPASRRYLVVVTHAAEDCLEALHAFEQKERALFQKVEWGCDDGVHSGWIYVDATSAKAALEKLPPATRDGAKAVHVETFTSAAERKHLEQTLNAERALQNQD